MNVNSWQMISEIKVDLLEIASSLIDDKVIPREVLALNLIRTVHALNRVEEECIYDVVSGEMVRLEKIKEHFEKEQEKLLERGNS